MKMCRAFLTTLFALASFPLLAQQRPPANQAPPAGAAPSPEASGGMSLVKCELVSRLDSKTAKTGDSVVVLTETPVQTADGTEIPKGSKLVGHVMAARASEAGENSQVALQFDHLELKSGQSVSVHSEIQSIKPAGGAASTSGSSDMSEAPASPNVSGASGGGSRASGAPQSSGDRDASAVNSPAPGTVVAKTGNIAIRTTSIPGVLVANNAPGQQDPRMGQSSGILLGAKQDIELVSGTQMVVGVSAAGEGAK